MEMRDCMLTTTDNVYNPLTHFEEWYDEDRRLGHDTCAYLARVAMTSPDLPDELNDQAIEEAMDTIIEINRELNEINGAEIFPVYVKVYEEET